MKRQRQSGKKGIELCTHYQGRAMDEKTTKTYPRKDKPIYVSFEHHALITQIAEREGRTLKKVVERMIDKHTEVDITESDEICAACSGRMGEDSICHNKKCPKYGQHYSVHTVLTAY